MSLEIPMLLFGLPSGASMGLVLSHYTPARERGSGGGGGGEWGWVFDQTDTLLLCSPLHSQPQPTYPSKSTSQ